MQLGSGLKASDDPVLLAIEVAKRALEQRHDSHWIVGFSGGKDSTATLKILLTAHKYAKRKPEFFEVIYCDTGVENLVLDRYVKSVFKAMKSEAEEDGLPVRTRLLKAPIHDRFFVKIIGRGYPPPTNSFRWCTNGLRIRPVATHILSHKPESTVLALGIRRGESVQRDRVIAKSSGSHWQKQQEGKKSYDLFAPIINLDTASVWDAVFGLSKPRSIRSQVLEDMYREASGECPIIKSPQAPPCASGRFGCWTCTVVRKDKSAQKLIDAGHEELRPFINFRNWLTEIRNDPNRRWPARRSGAMGMGPFTLAAREEILLRINSLEDDTGVTLIDAEERGAIAALWRLDHVPRLASPSISGQLKASPRA